MSARCPARHGNVRRNSCGHVQSQGNAGEKDLAPRDVGQSHAAHPNLTGADCPRRTRSQTDHKQQETQDFPGVLGESGFCRIPRWCPGGILTIDAILLFYATHEDIDSIHAPKNAPKVDGPAWTVPYCRGSETNFRDLDTDASKQISTQRTFPVGVVTRASHTQHCSTPQRPNSQERTLGANQVIGSNRQRRNPAYMSPSLRPPRRISPSPGKSLCYTLSVITSAMTQNAKMPLYMFRRKHWQGI